MKLGLVRCSLRERKKAVIRAVSWRRGRGGEGRTGRGRYSHSKQVVGLPLACGHSLLERRQCLSAD